MIFLTFVVVVAAVVFQAIEMQEYNLFQTMFGSK